MSEANTIRVLIYEGLRDALLNQVLSAAIWGISSQNIVSEPSEAPQTKQFLSIRIIQYNQRLDLVPQTVYKAGSLSDTDKSISLVRSTVRIQCLGAQAWGWLDAFLMALEDLTVIEYFRSKGFSVESDGAGISDISSLFGAREQTRGSALITVTCRAIRDRVITHTETVQIGIPATPSPPDASATVISVTQSLE